jgi:uncharacterized membrane protein
VRISFVLAICVVVGQLVSFLIQLMIQRNSRNNVVLVTTLMASAQFVVVTTVEAFL